MMRRVLPPAALVLAAAILAEPAAGRVVEAVVATVQASPSRPVRPITLTRLREEARVALVGRGATEAAFGKLDAKALSAALEWLIDQTLVAEEADRLLVAEVGREEAAAELRRFRARFASADEYARFLSGIDAPEEELVVTLARNLRVQRFVERRVGQTVRPTDGDVEDYLRARGVSPEAGAARDAVRAHLGEQRLAAEVRKIVGDLRGRAVVRILLPPAEVVGD
jgi:hypothetical protein